MFAKYIRCKENEYVVISNSTLVSNLRFEGCVQKVEINGVTYSRNFYDTENGRVYEEWIKEEELK